MNDRKKREKRRARMAAKEAAKPLPTARPSQRGTFRVAQAQRKLAAELPGVVNVRQSSPRPSLARVGLLETAPRLDQGDEKRRPSRVAETVRGSQPKLDKGNLHLKCRPKSNKPGAGGGSGREFVPWDKDC